MTRILVPLVFVFVVATTLGTNSALEVDVIDENGAVISNARITIHWDPSSTSAGLKSDSPADLVGNTDKFGKFWTEIAPSLYDVYVSSPAFSPACKKVRVQLSKSQIVRFKLKADPLVIGALGDQFPTEPH